MTSATVLTLLITWALLLLIVMEALRGRLVVAGRVAANEFRPDNSNRSAQVISSVNTVADVIF